VKSGVYMKVVAYNIREFEKEQLALANAKVHDLTLISNGLDMGTLHYAVGKEVVIISDRDVLDSTLLNKLDQIGVKKIITRSISLDHIDISHANKLGLHIANTPFEDQSTLGIAYQTIMNLNNWGDERCLGLACQCVLECEKKGVPLKQNYERQTK